MIRILIKPSLVAIIWLNQMKEMALYQRFIEDIGVRLTDGHMMEPEASVSAIVFAHPEARYFNVER